MEDVHREPVAEGKGQEVAQHMTPDPRTVEPGMLVARAVDPPALTWADVLANSTAVAAPSARSCADPTRRSCEPTMRMTRTLRSVSPDAFSSVRRPGSEPPVSSTVSGSAASASPESRRITTTMRTPSGDAGRW